MTKKIKQIGYVIRNQTARRLFGHFLGTLLQVSTTLANGNMRDHHGPWNSK